MSTTQLAVATGWRPPKISKIEHGRQTPTEADLSRWCVACHARDQLPDLIAAVRAIDTQFAEWRRILRTGTRRRQEASAKAYRKAKLFRIWEPALVPGLFQTLDYATAMLSITVDFFQLPDDVVAGAQARVQQQRVLADEDRRFHVVMGEQALHTKVGGAEVMTQQLRHVLDLLKFPQLRIGIIPSDAPYRVPLHSGFWLLDEALVQFDTYTAELSLIRPDEIAIYARAFERLAALAMYGREVRKALAEAISAHESGEK